MDERLKKYRGIWKEKPVLRAVYADYHRRIAERCKPGLTLEVGGGTGSLKEFDPNLLSTDILPAPWLDVAVDAQALPFADRCVDNIVMLDVLHHIPRPRLLFTEVLRVLRSGGRLVMLEPAITPLSWFFYKTLHQERTDLREDPLTGRSAEEKRDPYDGNTAIASLLFGRHRHRLELAFPSLRIHEVKLLSLFVFPLSGGFRRWSLLPLKWVEALLRVEGAVLGVLGPLMAFRLLAVMERE